MDWKEIGSKVADFAPVLGGLLGGPAGASIGAIVSATLGTKNNPADVMAAIAGNAENALKLKKLEQEHKTELIKLTISADTKKLEEVNKTIRAEYEQEDKYVKRWRPTFGYAVCFTWVVTWLAIVFVVLFEPVTAPLVINALAATTTMWGVALSILGVNVWKRSQDKKVLLGQDTSLVSKIIDKFK